MAEGLSHAVASATNRVRVTLSTAPMETGTGSAYLTGNWTVQRVGGAFHFLASVEKITDEIWELAVSPPLSGVSVAYEVSAASSLLADDGVTPYDTPDALEFSGVASAQVPQTLQQAVGYDLRLQTLGDKRTVAGTYAMTSSGDYALWAGPEARESDYLRRLSTPKGGFAHLPRYGIGLVPKRLVSTAAMLTLKRECETQMLREPGVVGVAPRITRLSGAVIQVGLSVQLAGGQAVETSQTIN